MLLRIEAVSATDFLCPILGTIIEIISKFAAVFKKWAEESSY